MRGTPDAYPFRTLPTPVRFAIALVPVLGVFALGSAFRSVVDDGSQFLLLGTAVMSAAWFAGTGPALAATVLGAVLGALELGSILHRAGSTHLALFVVQGLLLTAVIAELRAARRASEQRAEEARAARRAGEAANRTKDEFLATVSHELRTPLNAVLGWIHLLRTGKLDAATTTRGLESIDRNVRLQAQVTADLLDVSKALTGKLQVDTQPTLLTDAVRQALHGLSSAARAKGVEIACTLSDEPVVVLGDSNRLRQVAWHLLANAIKFTPRGGTIDVVVDAASDQARLIVSDSGRGIDPQFLPAIFDRFTQADSSPTRTAGGLGVGLALVRELVELHGGEVEARNREDGHGAVFVARFPLQQGELLARRATAEAGMPLVQSVSSPPLNGVRVLVLDHDSEARELLRTLLEQRGAAVRAVGSVADALDALEAWRPDVLVTDRLSREHDSYALVGKVQSLDADRGGRIPALALSCTAPSDERLARLLAQVQRDVPKPVEPAVLTTEIARLTGRERRRAQR